MRKLAFIGVLLAIAAISPAHAQSVSPDGSILLESLTNAAGMWTFGAPYSPGDWWINLNGQQIYGAGSEMVVANGGQLYALASDNNWYLWIGNGWTLTAPPVLPAPPANPPTIPSPDGTILLASVQTSVGVWTFGAPYLPGNWWIDLNGEQIYGAGSEMVVANGGQLYALASDNNWYVWQNGSWAVAHNPLGNPGPPNPGSTVVLTVGPSGQYQTISDAVAAADTDTNLGNYYDIQVTPGTYVNDFPYVTRPVTIEVDPSYAGSPVVLEAMEASPNEKGIILTVASLTVNGLTFTGAQIDNSLGGNGAGIRDQNTAPGATLTILNSTFTGNQEGVLTGDDAGETITVTNSNFINNGNPNINYFQHGLYVNGGTSLTVTNSLFCGQLIGHDIKSRAQATIVSGNQLYDGAANAALGCEAGSTSFAIDVPNGGAASISGNQIIQGPTTQNYNMVDYGEEGLVYSTNSLVVSGNNFTNSAPSAIAIYDPYCVIAQLSGNTFNGITTIIYPPGCAIFQ